MHQRLAQSRRERIARILYPIIELSQRLWGFTHRLNDGQCNEPPVSFAPPFGALRNPLRNRNEIIEPLRADLSLTSTTTLSNYRIPAGTLRDCEQNRKKPDSTAMAFLRVIAREPEIVAKALQPA